MSLPVLGNEALTALTASLRGHRVSLYEKGPALGGQLPLAAAPSDRRQFHRFKEYLISQVHKQDIELYLNTGMTPEKVLESCPDATRWSIIKDLKLRGVNMITHAEVVLALGVASDETISHAIRNQIKEVYVIGDAQRPRKALDAVKEGFDVGLTL